MDMVTQVQILDKTAFHTALIPLEKGINPSVPAQLSRKADWVLQPCYSNQTRRKKTEFKPVKIHFKTNFVLHPACAKVLDVYIRAKMHTFTSD